MNTHSVVHRPLLSTAQQWTRAISKTVQIMAKNVSSFSGSSSAVDSGSVLVAF